MPSITAQELGASNELLYLIFTAIEHGIESLAEGGPLIPFIMSSKDGVRHLTRYKGETLDESMEMARQAVGSLEADCWALALDGYVTYEGQRFDAIVVFGGDRGQAQGYQFAQRYLPADGERACQAVDNPAYLGRVPIPT